MKTYDDFQLSCFLLDSVFLLIFVLDLLIFVIVFCCFICFGTWSGENALATFLESAAGCDRIVTDYVQDVQGLKSGSSANIA